MSDDHLKKSKEIFKIRQSRIIMDKFRAMITDQLIIILKFLKKNFRSKQGKQK